MGTRVPEKREEPPEKGRLPVLHSWQLLTLQ